MSDYLAVIQSQNNGTTIQCLFTSPQKLFSKTHQVTFNASKGLQKNAGSISIVDSDLKL